MKLLFENWRKYIKEEIDQIDAFELLKQLAKERTFPGLDPTMSIQIFADGIRNGTYPKPESIEDIEKIWNSVYTIFDPTHTLHAEDPEYDIFENWRQYLKEETAAFHGFKMKPTQMRVSPQCDTPPGDDQWQTGEKGCPQFTNERGISQNHPDIIEAIEFLNNVKPSGLIAYSRGGAIAFAALARSDHSPKVTFVAPAWKRGWVSGMTPNYSNGVIIHGMADEAVPLKQSFELAQITGMPLYVFPNKKHISILKDKDSPISGIQVSPEALKAGLNNLPEWKGLGTPSEVTNQHRIAMEILK